MDNLELKRYLARYNYLETEYEWTKQEFEEYNRRFLEEYYSETELKEYKESHLGASQSPVVSEECSGESGGKELPHGIRGVYRRLTLLTHPDKVKGKSELFRRLQRAYNESNVIEILRIAGELGVKIDLDVKEVRPVFETVIGRLEKEISDLKQTLAWHWAHATEEEKEHYKRQNK
ncbi:hypothetical protein EB118_17645 [bacterium]|nr:hypothetical protein [bacterium]NDC95532.1 hypothetical protein [bacterium]NDD85150.1 hypothetical protein [bacterium]NDG31883.1 hypothetical protein [bacterium]